MFLTSSAPRRTARVAGLTLLGLALPQASISQLREFSIATLAIPQASPEAYQPCGGVSDLGTPAWCLTDRIRELERVDAGRFEGQDDSCRLIYPNEPVEQFACGDLLVGLRPAIDSEAREAIRQAAEGEWDPIYTAPWVIAAALRVEPGTERSALRNIIFHPMIMWVEFNHNAAVALGP